MTVFEEASCVFLFHNSLTGLNHANKHFITGALERMYVSGNLQRLVGVDLARPMLKTETGGGDGKRRRLTGDGRRETGDGNGRRWETERGETETGDGRQETADGR